MIITSLEQDLKATQAINNFRTIHGMPKARNPYSWWKYVFVALTYYGKTGATFATLLSDLNSIGIGGISRTTASLLTKVAEGQERNPITRDYTFNLPGVAHVLGLKICGSSYTGSRPAHVFSITNGKMARTILESRFPETVPLFQLLDKKKF